MKYAEKYALSPIKTEGHKFAKKYVDYLQMIFIGKQLLSINLERTISYIYSMGSSALRVGSEGFFEIQIAVTGRD